MKRFLALILALSLLSSFVSCKKEEGKSDRGTTLQIIKEPAIYSDELVSGVTARIISHVQPSESQRSKLESFIKTSVLPVLEDIPVYESELLQICDLAETVIDTEMLDIVSVCELYSKGVAILGNERNSALAYELTKLSFEYAKNEEKLGILTDELGRESFCKILSLFMFVGSFGAGIIPANIAGSSYISDADILNILQHEADHYASLSFDADKWSAGVKLLGALVSNIKSENYPVSAAVLNDLAKTDMFEKAAYALPELMNLLSAVLHNMTPAEIAALRKGEASPFSLSVKKLALCETEFKNFTSTLKNRASVGADAGRSTLESLGYSEAYEAFIVRIEGSNEAEIYDAINAYASSTSAIPPMKELRKSATAYIFEISPALAFAIERDLAPTTN